MDENKSLPLSMGTLVQLLGTQPSYNPVVAQTPHGTYTFDIVAVEVYRSGVVLRLKEQESEGTTT